MSKRTVEVSIDGCDDSNIFDVTVTDEQYKLLRLLAALSRRHSAYNCEPTMTTKESPNHE